MSTSLYVSLHILAIFFHPNVRNLKQTISSFFETGLYINTLCLLTFSTLNLKACQGKDFQLIYALSQECTLHLSFDMKSILLALL
jgi:hypothetical protein